MDANNMTPQQLRELAAEKEREQLELQANIPQMVDSPDLTRLKKHCQMSIDFAAGRIGRDEFDPEEHDTYVAEEAMKAFFGKGVYDWLNRAMRDK